MRIRKTNKTFHLEYRSRRDTKGELSLHEIGQKYDLNRALTLRWKKIYLTQTQFFTLIKVGSTSRSATKKGLLTEAYGKVCPGNVTA